MTSSDSPVGAAASGSFSAISEDECRTLLSVGIIGRVAFNSSAGIELIPLNYLYLNGAIYFRVDAASLLGELRHGTHEVAFEVDYHDDLIKQAWSVMVKGNVGAVTDPDELDTLRGKPDVDPWALGDRQLRLRLEPVVITGRKVKRNTP